MANKEGSEQWDDGNKINGDGCSSTCVIETGYSWSGNPSSWSTVWGDGLIKGSEEWDDKNTVNGDGWSSTCKVEENYSWNGQPSSCSISVQINYLSYIIGSWIQGLFGLSISSQFIVSSILGESLSVMWMMINTLQVINYIVMFTLYYPRILIMLAWPINLANMENEYFSKVYIQ